MTDIYVTMPCDVCGHTFTSRFDPTDGRWKGMNPWDDPDECCDCMVKMSGTFDMDGVDESYVRMAAIADRLAAQVREALADTMRITFARSVPANQAPLEGVTV